MEEQITAEKEERLLEPDLADTGLAARLPSLAPFPEDERACTGALLSRQCQVGVYSAAPTNSFLPSGARSSHQPCVV